MNYGDEIEGELDPKKVAKEAKRLKKAAKRAEAEQDERKKKYNSFSTVSANASRSCLRGLITSVPKAPDTWNSCAIELDVSWEFRCRDLLSNNFARSMGFGLRCSDSLSENRAGRTRRVT